jgi:hypothetical protein
MPICYGLEQRKIMDVIAHRRFSLKKGLFPKWKFTYNVESDTYTCPNSAILMYSTTNREGYRQYHSNLQTCKSCPFLSQCTTTKNHKKIITRHVWESSKEKVRDNRLSLEGKTIYKKEKKR